MEQKYTFLLVGGDMRQVFLAQKLIEDGHRVSGFAWERNGFFTDISHANLANFTDFTAVILPMPAEREAGVLYAPLCNTSYRIQTILDAIPAQTLVLTGGASEAMKKQAKRNHLLLRDYLAREELAIGNAIPTSEGAIQLAMEELPITLHGAKVLVIGAGRIGRYLAQSLQALHANVTVSARSAKDFAVLASMGFPTMHTHKLHLHGFDLIFNTVPAMVLGEELLEQMPESCLVIDLASRPGGVDFDAAAKLGRRVIWALSLPGKVAPVSAANTIRNTIYTILQEETLP